MRKRPLPILSSLSFVLCLTGLTQAQDGVPLSGTLPEVPDFSLDVPAVPETTGLPVEIVTTDDANTLYAWDIFAWKTFAAMNWPAIAPAKNNGYLRGYPDLTRTFAGVTPADGPLVWETLKEKREMFIHGASTLEAARPNPWSSPYEYGPDQLMPLGKDGKRLFGSAKFTTLDESVEVHAEALEEFYSGLGGGGLPTLARIFRLAGGTTTAGPADAVRYEVKVNYDFYKYVVDNGLYFDPAAAARAKSRPPIQLPWRTSLSDPGFNFLTQKPADLPYVQGYRTDRTVAAYRAGAAARHLSDGTRTNAPVPGDYQAPVPPRTGAIHLKAAWAPIEPSEASHFITREAQYFTGDDKEPATGLFGLVGLHIIQRIMVIAPHDLLNYKRPGIKHGPPAKGATGGTFIYSTWEHRELNQGNDDRYSTNTKYVYTNYFQVGPRTFVPLPALTGLADNEQFEVKRVFPILDHTTNVNEFVWQKYPDSVWKNYRLVGTQFTPVKAFAVKDGASNQGIPSDPLSTENRLRFDHNTAAQNGREFNDLDHQPAYLANLAIETNLGLQVFQGLPPNVEAAPQFFNSNSKNKYKRTASNVAFGGQGINTGGCMGCHAVAQQNGYAFSFVLLGGQAGASPDSEIDTGFEAPLTSRSVGLLQTGRSVPLQSQATSRFLAAEVTGASGITVELRDAPQYFTVGAGDLRVADSPFRFGDGVTLEIPLLPASAYLGIQGDEVAYLTERNATTVWNLHDPLDPLSTGDVLRRDSLSFRNASSGKFLQVDGDQVTLTSTAKPFDESIQWNTASLFVDQVVTLDARPSVSGPALDFEAAGGQPIIIGLPSDVPTHRPLRYGDTINLKVAGGGYLHQAKTGEDIEPVMIDGTTGEGEGAWTLVDFLQPESNGPVLRLTDIGFRNAKTGYYLGATSRALIAVQPHYGAGFTLEWNIIPQN